MQDTVRQQILRMNDSAAKPGSESHLSADTAHLSHKIIIQAVHEPLSTDTATVCERNILTKVSVQDSVVSISTTGQFNPSGFPVFYIERNREIDNQKREVLLASLRQGEPKPAEPFRSDWIVPLLFFAALLLGIVRSVPGNFFRNIFRNLLMRGINENGSRDTGVLFQWQSTLMNLSAFISISLFGLLAMKFYGLGLPGLSSFVTWLLCFGLVILAVTLRHFVCNITGNLSDEQEIFREYITTIYHGYRAAGILFLILSFLVLYAPVLPSGLLFSSGIVVLAMLYILRVTRLFLIFITRHVSILYLILYLCALEILPVVILVKYVTGLV